MSHYEDPVVNLEPSVWVTTLEGHVCPYSKHALGTLLACMTDPVRIRSGSHEVRASLLQVGLHHEDPDLVVNPEPTLL